MDTVTRCRSIRTAGFLRLSLLAAVIYSANSNSADIGAAFSVGVGYTDNINLDVVDGVDETIASSGGRSMPTFAGTSTTTITSKIRMTMKWSLLLTG
jgi:hypothetical protein